MQLSDIYNMQCVNQQLLIDNGKYDGVTHMSLPNDNVSLSSYHIQQLVSEIGEVLAADKRWKNIRNDKYDSENKLEEIADCFIVLMNIAIFSGIDAETLEKAMRTLTELSDEDRLVGIISHVDALRNRIDKQIIVTKDRSSGSRVDVITQ